jgi:RNA polymerase sigma-70 factor, ECF subfamily
MNAPNNYSPLTATDDATLARAACTDKQAFTELYRRHALRVYRYVLAQTGHVQDAEDVTAQTFMCAMRDIASFRGQGPFAAWLLRIARHRALDHFRSQRNPLSFEEVDNDTQADAKLDALDVIVGRRLQLRELALALSQLAPDRAEALRLRLFGDLSVAEAAQVMNKSEAAIKMLVQRGLADLRGRLQVWAQEDE